MGLPDDLKATVIANDPCPLLQKGPGQIVLTTVNHLNSDIRELTVGNSAGVTAVVRPTGFHKFCRADNGSWVSAAELASGVPLVTHNGTVVVLSNDRVLGVHRVYNMTVEGEHVYEVSPLGIVAHNTACSDAANAAKALAKKTGLGEYRQVGGHHIHAKSGFGSNGSYSAGSGLSISQEYMTVRGWDHQAITNRQRELFNDLARSGRANTLAEHSRIAREALIAGGATRA